MEKIEIACGPYSVCADWYEGKDTNRILLSLIGWTSNKSKYSDILKGIIENTGMSALVFDYSGHGDSKIKLEDTKPAQHFLEVIYVFDWIKKNYPKSSISVMGTSYGGYLATQLTKYRTFDNLILRVPAIYQPGDFYNFSDKIHNSWTRSVYRKDEKALEEHPLLARASKFAGNTLVIVHEKDEQVPKETTDVYIKFLHSDVYLAKGFTHSMESVPEEEKLAYQKAISKWLNRQFEKIPNHILQETTA